MVYTFSFAFYNPTDMCCDETEFCAENSQEAIEMFKDFCKENGYDYYKTNSVYSIIYNQEDADVYGDEYASQRDINEYLMEMDEYAHERQQILEETQAYWDAYMETHGSVKDNW